MSDLGALPREVVDELFLYMSNLRAPLRDTERNRDFHLTGVGVVEPALDFASCRALALVTPRLAQCWRRFQARYLLLTLEAIYRGRQLAVALARLASDMYCAQTAHMWPQLFDAFCERLDREPQMLQLGAFDDSDKAFYDNRRCMAEAARANHLIFDGLPHAVVADAAIFDRNYKPRSAGVVLPDDAYVRKLVCRVGEAVASRTGGLLPQRLMQLLVEHLGYDEPWYFAENIGMYNTLTALRAAVSRCSRVFDGREKTLALPAELFARQGGATAPLLNETLETASTQHSALLAAAERATIECAESRARALTFMLFRCALATSFDRTGTLMYHAHASTAGDNRPFRALKRIDTDINAFRVNYGIRVSDTHVHSAADILLHRALIVDTDAYKRRDRTQPAHSSLPDTYLDFSISLQTGLDYAARALPPHPNRQFSAEHRGAAAFAQHLQRVLGVLRGKTPVRNSATLTLPLHLGRIPTLRISFGLRVNSAQLLVMSSNHTHPETKQAWRVPWDYPVAYLPFVYMAHSSPLGNEWLRIGDWFSNHHQDATTQMVDWQPAATTSFDIRLDDYHSHMACDSERYRNTVLAELANPTIPDRPHFVLEPLSERINYIIEYLAQLEPPAATEFLNSCTLLTVYCTKCETTRLMQHELSTGICRICTNRATTRKRKMPLK